jgi:TatD DNase family protein
VSDWQLIDTHCHLDFPQFDADREAVWQRARNAGVAFIVNPGSDLASSRRAVAQAESDPAIYAAVGVHPHEVKDWDASTMTELRTLAAHPRVVAIGEIGLDYYRDLSPRPVQMEVFRRQLDLAAEMGKPVIIHDRDAHVDLARILAEWLAELGGHRERAGVLHSFSGDLALARQVLDWGFLIGLGGPLTFQNARPLQALARNLPLDKVLIETDSPYLSPHPFRGQRNEPSRVSYVARMLAELQGRAVLDVANQTTINAKRLFGIP